MHRHGRRREDKEYLWSTLPPLGCVALVVTLGLAWVTHQMGSGWRFGLLVGIAFLLINLVGVLVGWWLVRQQLVAQHIAEQRAPLYNYI